MNSDHILVFKLKEIVQLDLENMKARLEGVDSSNRLFLERELAVLAKQLSDFKTDFKSATASLKIRIQDLEAQNTKVTAVIETSTHMNAWTFYYSCFFFDLSSNVSWNFLFL